MLRLTLLSLGILASATAFAGEKSVTIPAGKIQEECFQLTEGSRLRYAFDASDTLQFNLHYHQNEDVHYPVPISPEKALTEQEFIAPLAQTFCLMWKNSGKTPVSLHYRYTVHLD